MAILYALVIRVSPIVVRYGVRVKEVSKEVLLSDTGRLMHGSERGAMRGGLDGGGREGCQKMV